MIRKRCVLETLKLVSPYIESSGISRVANISHLDNSSLLNVYSAIRPLSKSISVSMGKSLDKHAAKCGAIIESVEAYFSEEVKPHISNISSGEIVREAVSLNINSFTKGKLFDLNYRIDWQIGSSLISSESVYIPLPMLSIDTTKMENIIYGCNSDGLASGNSFEEALVVSIFENIERYSLKKNHKKKFFLQGNITEEYALSPLLNTDFYKYENEYGLPVIECKLTSKNPFINSCVSTGVACSYNISSAARRALEEALQTKVGLIAGARDDITSENYIYDKDYLCTNDQKIHYIPIYESEAKEAELILQDIRNLLTSLKKDIVVHVLLNGKITILRSYIVDEKSYIQ